MTNKSINSIICSLFIMQASTCTTTRSIQAFQQTSAPSLTTHFTNRNEPCIYTNNEKSLTFLNQQQHIIGRPSSSSLNSIHSLIEDLSSSTQPSTRTVFVGGKGGVGKTTVSSSLAVTLSSLEHNTNNHKILVVSTDPAHSLGDALDVNLKQTSMNANTQQHNKAIVQMTDPITMGNLYAMEVNTDAAIEKFQNVLSSFNVETISETYGISPELLSSFGLDDISNLLSNPPPGLDELIALSQILNDDYIQSQFDIIVVDTAPTGHTLRMLALPEFLDGFLSKLLTLRQKLSGVINMVQTFMGAATGSANAEQFDNRKQSIDTALGTIEEFRSSMNTLRQTLSNDQLTNFVIVSIPTKLSVNESKRLMAELIDQKIKVSDIVVNQCVVGESAQSGDNDAMEAMMNYYNRRKTNQMKWVNDLQSTIDTVSASDEYKKNGGGSITLTQVPFFDVELVGTPALAYLGSTVFNSDNFKYLMDEDSSEEDAKFVICGGKGGVGKTTTSSSLAVTMAAAGRNVALVSTDPAHSLGDVFDLNFSGGNLVDVPLIGVPYTDGSLSVLEVDPSKSLSEFKGLIDNFIGSKDDTTNEMGSDLGKTLRELGDVFDTLPAGTDEVVALAKVVGLIKNGNFDRIVLDTAPTGHTLRMLSTPGFISELIDKVISISNKINSNSMLKMMISNAAGGDGLDEKAKAAKQALVNFQFQMYDLEDLFSNPDQTEFLIVTVPTELAVRESTRLLNDLTYEAPDMPIKVRNVVANQVLKDDGSDVSIFLNRVADGQRSSIQELKEAANSLDRSVEITEIPYLDTEPRGVFGLKVLSGELMKEVIN